MKNKKGKYKNNKKYSNDNENEENNSNNDSDSNNSNSNDENEAEDINLKSIRGKYLNVYNEYLKFFSKLNIFFIKIMK